MIVRRLDKCGDITTRGEPVARSIGAIEQLVVMRLKLFKGEYFRNVTEGVPWWQDILGKQPDRTNGEQIIRNRIARTPGVTNITRFEVSYVDREMYIQCSFNTKYGEGNVEYGTVNS